MAVGTDAAKRTVIAMARIIASFDITCTEVAL